MIAVRRMLTAALVVALLPLSACPPPPPPPDPVVERGQPTRSDVPSPPLLVSAETGAIAVPWAPNAARAEAWPVDLFELPTPDLAAWLAAWKPTPQAARRKIAMPDVHALPTSKPGAYVVRLASGARATTGLVLASTLRVALVLGDSDFDVYCIDTQTRTPVESAFIRVLIGAERLGKPYVRVASGTTNAAGRWHGSLVRDEFAPAIVATAVAGRDGRFALDTARRTLDHGGADWRVRLRARSPSFRPGQRADFTGVLQRRANGHVSAVANVQVRLDLVDAKDSLVAATRVRTDAVGAFTSAFQLPPKTPPGIYSAIVTIEGRSRFEPVRAPLLHVRPVVPVPFRVGLKLGAKILQPGATLQLTVSAQDAENLPLPDARVQLVSWGYPVSAAGTPGWASGEERIDPSRVHALPLALPVDGKTGADGTLVVPWTFSGADSLTHDLLCGIQAQVTIPELGTVTRTGELLLLRAPPPVSISLPKTFYRPSEPITASFIGSVAPQDTDTLPVTCTLSHEGRDGETGEQVLAISAEALASRRLVLQASRPGRYVLRLQSRGAPSEAVFWVVDGAGDLHWDGAQAPLLVAERGWMRAGESMSAVVAAPAGAPLALTFRSGSRVRRETVPLLTGARTLTLQADDYPTDPVHVTLVQMTPDGARKGRGAIGIEPGGQTLEVRPKLLYVRTGDTPLRGFGINTHDRLGQPVQSIVGLELVRPSFLGTPPVAVHRNTLQWHHGRATSVDGAMEVAYNPALLARSYGLFIEALAPDGRSGTHMMPTQDPAAGPVGEKAPPPSPAEKFAAISARGLSSPVVRWLAALLVQRHPTLAERLPDLAAGVASSEDAVVLVQLAEGSPASLRATLRALAARRDSTAAAALGAASRHAAALRPIFEQALASHPFPATRSQAATALAHALPASHGALAAALLTDSSAQVRAAAAHALASGGPASVHALTEAAAQEQDGTVLLAIAESLGVHGNVEAARALLQLASRRQPALVIAAVQALDAIGYKGAHPRILRILRSGPLAARPVAARLLLRSDDTAARDAVLSAVERKPTGALMAALAQTHGSDVDALARRWLKHADPAVRLAAAERFIADEPLLAKPVLRALLDASQPAAVADRAAQLLIASRDDASILKVMALADAGRLTRPTTVALIRTAAALGWHDTGRLLVGILWRGLADPASLSDPAERALWVDALRAAARVGPIWNATVERSVGASPAGGLYAPALDALRRDGFDAFLRILWYSPLDVDLRREAVSAYARLKGATATPDLLKLLESPALQSDAARALARLGATASLIQMCRHPLSRVRAAAAAALGQAGEKQAVPALRAMLEDKAPFPRLQAAWALAALTQERVLYTDPFGEPAQAAPEPAPKP